MELPGWNSIETTGTLSGIFFWVSIVALLLLGVAEVISHRYSERHDWLLSQKHQAEKNASDTEIARLHRDTATANARAQEAAKEAGLLGTSVGSLRGFVADKQREIDAEFSQFKSFAADETKRTSAVIAQLNDNRDKLEKAQQEAAAAAARAEKAAGAVAPRTITPEQKTALIALLKDKPKGSVAVSAKLFDEEAERFAKQILEVLTAAGYPAVEVRGPFSFGESGQWILVRDLHKWQTGPSYLGELQAGLTATCI